MLFVVLTAEYIDQRGGYEYIDISFHSTLLDCNVIIVFVGISLTKLFKTSLYVMLVVLGMFVGFLTYIILQKVDVDGVVNCNTCVHHAKVISIV